MERYEINSRKTLVRLCGKASLTVSYALFCSTFTAMRFLVSIQHGSVLSWGIFNELCVSSRNADLIIRLIRLKFYCGVSCSKTSLIRATQMSDASLVSLQRWDRLRKPCGISSTTVRLTGWPMLFSFLANITESSSRASKAEAYKKQ